MPEPIRMIALKRYGKPLTAEQYAKYHDRQLRRLQRRAVRKRLREIALANAV